MLTQQQLENACKAGRWQAGWDADDESQWPQHLPPLRRRNGLSFNLQAVERAAIVEAMDKCDWSPTLAAKLLGISRSALYAKLERHGLKETKPLNVVRIN